MWWLIRWRQRVAIARALIDDPLVIIGEAPTGNLDSKNTKVVFETFMPLTREKNQNIITVTPDDDFAMNCDRVIELSDGSLIT